MPFPTIHSQAFDSRHSEFDDRQAAYLDALAVCYRRSQDANETGRIFVYVTDMPSMTVAPGQHELHFFRTDDQQYVAALRSYSHTWLYRVDIVEIDAADMFRIAGERSCSV